MESDPTTTADLLDERGDEAVLCELELRQYGGVTAFAGEIATLRCHEDNVLVRETISSPGKGRVLVVDGGGSLRAALVGDQLAELARASGWRGLVIYGAVRDAARLRELGIGVVALGTCPRRSRKAGGGSVDVPVRFGGVTFEAGGSIVVDEDGVAFLPPSAGGSVSRA